MGSSASGALVLLWAGLRAYYKQSSDVCEANALGWYELVGTKLFPQALFLSSDNQTCCKNARCAWACASFVSPLPLLSSLLLLLLV